MQIISADERAQKGRFVKGLIVGEAGIGKTSLLYSLKTKHNLFVNIESGDLSVKDWEAGTELKPQTWQDCRDIAAAISGPDMAVPPGSTYSQAHVDQVRGHEWAKQSIKGAELLFVDSITAASYLCARWAKGQPEATAKNGKPDGFGLYGLIKTEMISWLNRLQRVPYCHVFLVGILDEKAEVGGPVYTIQMEGAATAKALEGILDQIITYKFLTDKEGNQHRAFICQYGNQFGVPAISRQQKAKLLTQWYEVHEINKLKQKEKNRDVERDPFDD